MQLYKGRKWIKIGKLHSQKALLKREQEWQKAWSFLVQYSACALDELRSDDNDETISNEHNCSLSQASVHGFKKDERTLSLSMYYMLMDQIHNLEAEEDLSTDEDEIENLIPKDCREKVPQSSRTAGHHDTSLPELLLQELNPKNSVLHCAPPYLSPGYTLNPAGTEVKHRSYVLLERLNKDLDTALLVGPQKSIIVTTDTQSRVLWKRGNNDKAALLNEEKAKGSRKCVKKRASKEKRKRGNNDKAELLNEKKAKGSRKCVKKRASKEEDIMTNSCAVNRHIRRSRNSNLRPNTLIMHL